MSLSVLAVAAFFLIGGWMMRRCDGIEMTFLVWGLGMLVLTFFNGNSLPAFLQERPGATLLTAFVLWGIGGTLGWFKRMERFTRAQ